MKRLGRLSVFLMMMLLGNIMPVIALPQTQLRWETLKAVPPTMKPIMSQNDIAVFAAPSVIAITVSHPVNIKIFTILGKLVTSKKLEPGIYEFNLNAHGVYIIKTDDTTCKVAT